MPYVKCNEGAEYEIPLVCGKVYIGQTGRCTNDRLREHAPSLENGTALQRVQMLTQVAKNKHC